MNKFRANLKLIFSLAEQRINDYDPNTQEGKDFRETLNYVRDALFDMQTDNEGQIVIYTGARDENFEEEPPIGSNHVFKGSSIVDDCSLCGFRYAHWVHHDIR